MPRWARVILWMSVFSGLTVWVPGQGSRNLGAQEEPRVVELTMENMVDLTMSSSFRVRRLNLNVERDRYNLKAQRARLKSSVDLDLTVPAFRLTSEPKWNSELQKNEIIQENTRQWEGEISIRQPLILFGYPTNGYLSVNNRMYRYRQIEDDGSHDVDYYNRYYISYTQPLFQANSLKNDLEQAEMELEETQLDFYRDILGIVSGVSEGYHDLLEDHYTRFLRRELVADLERALELAREQAEADSTRAVAVGQVQIELANAREQLQSAESSIRLAHAYVKQELGLAEEDSLVFRPEFHLDPVPVDLDLAVQYAMELTPRLRQLDIGLRNREIWLDETRSRNGLRLNLRMSYGREVRDDAFGRLWVDPENSYTINVSAFLPLWDWGERRARVQAQEVGLEQMRLRIEEAQLEMVSGTRNEVLNVRDREARTMAMEENLELARAVAESSFTRFRNGAITAQDLILTLRRKAETGENFLDAYVSWRGSLRGLQWRTYYNFELDTPILDWFREEGWVDEDAFNGGWE
jgi:outer membrane protein TolC